MTKQCGQGGEDVTEQKVNGVNLDDIEIIT